MLDPITPSHPPQDGSNPDTPFIQGINSASYSLWADVESGTITHIDPNNEDYLSICSNYSYIYNCPLNLNESIYNLTTYVNNHPQNQDKNTLLSLLSEG